MFEDCLIESTRHIAKRRGLTTLFSISMQMFALMLLVIFPLLRTNVLSPQHLTGILPMPPMSAPPVQGSRPLTGTVDSGRITPPIQVSPIGIIPRGIVREAEPVGPPQPPKVLCLSDCGTFSKNGVWDSIGTAHPPEVALLKPKPVIMSQLTPGLILRRVEPLYPPLARTARIQGPVILHALISREGTIEQLQVLSGHPMLTQAALDAVQQWRFRPYILNGQPIEVETQITVNFILGE